MKINTLCNSLLLFLSLVTAVSCQKKNAQEKHAPNTVAEPQWKFPDDWYGKYRGDLQIFNNQGKAMTVLMELEVLRSDTAGRVNWNIIYDPKGKNDFRSYAIFEKDTKKGEYIMDEFNNILINTYLMDNTFYSRFAVMGSDLLCAYRYSGDAIDFNIMVTSSDSLSVTGGTSEDVPPVIDYRVFATQRCHLVRYQK